MDSKTNWRKPFFTILIGQAFSLLSSAIVQFAIVLYITDVTRSATLLSMGMLLAFLPQAVLGPIIGVYIDRWSRKRVMIIADASIAVVSLILVIVGMFMQLPIWLIMFVLFARSLGSTFHGPAFSAVTPLIVPEDYLNKCAGYSQTIQSISLIMSPALGAMLYTMWELNIIIAVDVVGALIGVFAVVITKIPELVIDKSVERPHVLTEAKDGFMVLKKHRGFITLLLLGAVFFFAFMPLNALFPLMSMDYFGGTAFHVSVVEIAWSVGMLIGGIALGIWGGFKKRIHSIAIAVLVLGAATVVMGLVPPSGFVIFSLMSFIMGLSVPFYSGVFMALMQAKIEPEYLGRVTSLSMSIMALAAPIGLVIIGPLAEIVSMSVVFFWAGIIVVLSGIVTLVLPSTRHIDEDHLKEISESDIIIKQEE